MNYAANRVPLRNDRRLLTKHSAIFSAIILALAYAAVSITYIFGSSVLAEVFAEDLRHLSHLELVKGLAFVIVSSVLLFVLTYKSLTHLIAKENQIYRQRLDLNEAENRSTAGLFASSVAHDINNILMISQHAVDMLSECKLPEKGSKELSALKEANVHLNKLAKRLSQAGGRHLTSGRKPIEAVETIRDAIALVQTHNKVKRCTLDTDLPEQLHITADALTLHRLILNLVINAAEAIPLSQLNGRIRVAVQSANSKTTIAVHDNGPGIPESQRKLVFEPFFSTKDAGTGLGLLSARLFAEGHDGKYDIVKSPLLEGACVFVSFPDPPPGSLHDGGDRTRENRS